MRKVFRGLSSPTSWLVLACLTWSAPRLAPAAPISLANPGPYGAGYLDVQVPQTGGGTFAATLYYPATANGAGAAFNGSGGAYPGISFGHGFLQTVDKYQSTLEHLASWGYFVIAPKTETGLFPNHSNFASNLRDGLSYLTTQNSLGSSPYFGHVNTSAYGLSGHSMGGGASILAAAADSRVKAVMNMAAANTNPSAIAQMPNVTAPIALLSGSEDSIAPINNHQQPMYDAGGPPKQIDIIQGGFHCGFEDSTFIFCDMGSITRDQQLAITRAELTSYFNFYLKGDQSLWREVWGPERFAGSQVTPQAASGIGVTPLTASQSVLPGQTVHYSVNVTNSGRQSTSYALLTEDQHWTTSVSPAITPVLAPGQSTTVDVAVTAPWGTFSASDQLLLSARSNADGLTRGYTTLSTQTPAFTPEIALASLGNARALKFDGAGNGANFADSTDGLLTPLAVAYDSSGNLFVADALRSRVQRFDSAGNGTVFAGLSSGLTTPSGLAFDSAGNLYVSNYLTHSIIKLSPGGTATPFAGSADGLDSPFGLTVDAAGNVYVADLGTRQILKFDSAGHHSVFADAGDGLLTPFGLAIDHLGNVYVSDVLRSRITRFDAAGNGTVFADAADGLTTPAGLAFDALDQLYVSNYLTNSVVRVSTAGVGSLFADLGDGLNSPFGLATRLLGGPAPASLSAAQLPEPSALALALSAAGLLALGWQRWR